MKVLLIYNPNSGNGTFKNYLDYIIGAFQNEHDIIIPHRIVDGESLDYTIQNIKEDEYSKVLIAGGDGTIHQVINRLIDYGIDLPIAVFPVGTANDYAQYFSLPKSVKEMTQLALSSRYTYSDVGKVNNRYFINVASLGFLIDISQKTDTKIKSSLGVLAYYIKGLEELPNIHSFNVQVAGDTCDFSGEIYFMLIMNGKSAGGFKKIAPFSSINDGLLDVYIFKKCALYELMPLLIRVFNGEHFNSPYVSFFQTNKLDVYCEKRVGTDLDGEEGPELPLHIECIPKKLKIITKVPLE